MHNRIGYWRALFYFTRPRGENIGIIKILLILSLIYTPPYDGDFETHGYDVPITDYWYECQDNFLTCIKPYRELYEYKKSGAVRFEKSKSETVAATWAFLDYMYATDYIGATDVDWLVDTNDRIIEMVYTYNGYYFTVLNKYKDGYTADRCDVYINNILTVRNIVARSVIFDKELYIEYDYFSKINENAEHVMMKPISEPQKYMNSWTFAGDMFYVNGHWENHHDGE
jgi:hypothetical protein